MAARSLSYNLRMFKKVLFILVCLGLFLNQAGRIDFQNDVSLTMLDASVACYVLFGITTQFKKIKNELLKLPRIVGVLFLIVIVSLIFNIKNYTIFQNLVAWLYLIRLLIYLLIFPISKILFQTIKEKIFLQKTLFITGFCLVVAGFVQYSFYSNLRNLYYAGWDEHMYRLFSSFFDPNFAGAFFSLFFIFLLGIWFSNKSILNKYYKVSLLISLFITLFAIFLTFSRSSLIMLVVSSLLFFVLQMKKHYIFIILGCLVLMLVIVAPKQNIENTDYFRTASVNARFAAIGNVLYVIQRNPILGVGYDAYRYAQSNYGLVKHSPLASYISHADAGTDNSLLFVWATTGFFGFMAFLYMVISLFKNSYMLIKKNVFSCVFFASLAGVLVDSMFINSLFYPSILLWLCLLAVFVFKD